VQTDLQQRARKVLETNWRDGFTIPSKRLYPFQWNWDSGFIAHGYLHFDLDKARQEIAHLFDGQWSHGMLPHIIFRSQPATPYFPNASFWDSQCSPLAPKDLATSGITQPPVHGAILQAIYRKQPQQGADFVKFMWPKVMALHRYFYQYRDPKQEGLVYIQHNWESGFDNAPIWDQPLANIDLSTVTVPAYQRADTGQVDPEQRPTKTDYDRYIYLVDLFKKHRYHDGAVAEHSPFLVQDPTFNALLIRSNESLLELAAELQLDPQELHDWQELSTTHINQKLWNEELGYYQAWDLVKDQPIISEGLPGYLPLCCAAPGPVRAQKMVRRLFEEYSSNDYRLLPSQSPFSSTFDPKKYWRGPVWINTNWLIHQGLRRYGYEEEASQLKQSIVDTLSHFGFYEYFDPRREQNDAKGYGGDDFSWSAALLIDLLNQ
jgi:glycogen debranching enzyme